MPEAIADKIQRLLGPQPWWRIYWPMSGAVIATAISLLVVRFRWITLVSQSFLICAIALACRLRERDRIRRVKELREIFARLPKVRLPKVDQ